MSLPPFRLRRHYLRAKALNLQGAMQAANRAIKRRSWHPLMVIHAIEVQSKTLVVLGAKSLSYVTE